MPQTFNNGFEPKMQKKDYRKNCYKKQKEKLDKNYLNLQSKRRITMMGELITWING